MTPEETINALRDFAVAHTILQSLRMVNIAGNAAENLAEESRKELAEVTQTERSLSEASARAAAQKLLAALLGRQPTAEELARVIELDN